MIETPESNDPDPMREAPDSESPVEGTDQAEPVGEAPTVDEAIAVSSTPEERFHVSGALNGRGALSITGRQRTTAVVLAGAVRSGKSTILASVYERFGRGPVGGHLFAGSRTISGFERLCHRGRVKSGADRAGMEHTPRTASTWLHLRLREEAGNQAPRDLLLADMSGEHFDALLAGKKQVDQMTELWRADHICLLLDGRNFARPAQRAGERRRALDLCTHLLDNSTDLARRSVMTIVITKWDLIHRAGTEATDATASTVEELEHLMHSRDVPLALVRTAARSVTHEFPLGHGVDDLLNRWTDRPVVQVTHPAKAPKGISMFDRYSAPSQP